MIDPESVHLSCLPVDTKIQCFLSSVLVYTVAGPLSLAVPMSSTMTTCEKCIDHCSDGESLAGRLI